MLNLNDVQVCSAPVDHTTLICNEACMGWDIWNGGVIFNRIFTQVLQGHCLWLWTLPVRAILTLAHSRMTCISKNCCNIAKRKSSNPAKSLWHNIFSHRYIRSFSYRNILSNLQRKCRLHIKLMYIHIWFRMH